MSLPNAHSGWTNRGYLPHFDGPGMIQAVTFRLGDSMPADKRDEWEFLLNLNDVAERARKLERYLDQGAGSCLLRRPECADVVQNALLHFHESRYRLLAWCVMPNHVHVLLETWQDHPLGRVVHSWKTFSAREINRLLHRSGALWQQDYYDTFMRDEEHLEEMARYVERNPINAALVKQPSEWRWSSAHPINRARLVRR